VIMSVKPHNRSHVTNKHDRRRTHI